VHVTADMQAGCSWVMGQKRGQMRTCTCNLLLADVCLLLSLLWFPFHRAPGRVSNTAVSLQSVQ
jgi:hypothetical protein